MYIYSIFSFFGFLLFYTQVTCTGETSEAPASSGFLLIFFWPSVRCFSSSSNVYVSSFDFFSSSLIDSAEFYLTETFGPSWLLLKLCVRRWSASTELLSGDVLGWCAPGTQGTRSMLYQYNFSLAHLQLVGLGLEITRKGFFCFFWSWFVHKRFFARFLFCLLNALLIFVLLGSFM